MGLPDIETTIVSAPSLHSNSGPAGTGVPALSNDIIKKYGQTQRGLSGRHVQLMAIGGSIGTGLFVGIGSSLRTAGPL